MNNSEVESNYLEYVDNIKNGRYIIPPVLIIYDALCNRYGEERVDASNLERVSNITLTNLASRESFNSICEFYSLDYTDIDVDNDNFIMSLYTYINTAFIIKYPFITISNSKREYHTIKDLYVKFEFTSEGRMCGGAFTMQRSTYSLKEFLYNYKHSHVGTVFFTGGRISSRSNIREFSSVCLGTGPIKDIIAGLEAPYSEEGFNEVVFMQFLNLLDEFVAWESIEGVPYRHLANISKQTIDNLTEVQENDLRRYSSESERDRITNIILQEDVLDTIQEYLYTIPKVVNGRPYIVVKCDEYALQKYLTTVVDIGSSFISDSVVIYKKDDFGRITYFRKNRNIIDRELLKESLNEVQNTDLFTFKGEIIKLNIEGLEVLNNVESEESYEYFLHPQFISDIIKYTEIIINSKYATQTKLYEPSTL